MNPLFTNSLCQIKININTQSFKLTSHHTIPYICTYSSHYNISVQAFTIAWHTCNAKQCSSHTSECQHLSSCNAMHNHNSYTKISKKIYHHKTKNTTIIHDIFRKLQTSNRQSDRSKQRIACYEQTIQIWA